MTPAQHDEPRPDGLLPVQALARYRPLVYALILDRVHHAEVAEDLTQETLAAAAGALPRLREPRAVRAWLRQIALNCCRMWWRRPEPDPEPLSEHYQRLVSEDAYAAAAHRETWRELQRAIDGLPEKSRLALLMHVFGGLDHEEIAEALELTAGSVAVRIHRARLRLRRDLRAATGESAPRAISQEEWNNAEL